MASTDTLAAAPPYPADAGDDFPSRFNELGQAALLLLLDLPSYGRGSLALTDAASVFLHAQASERGLPPPPGPPPPLLLPRTDSPDLPAAFRLASEGAAPPTAPHKHPTRSPKPAKPTASTRPPRTSASTSTARPTSTTPAAAPPDPAQPAAETTRCSNARRGYQERKQRREERSRAGGAEQQQDSGRLKGKGQKRGKRPVMVDRGVDTAADAPSGSLAPGSTDRDPPSPLPIAFALSLPLVPSPSPPSPYPKIAAPFSFHFLTYLFTSPSPVVEARPPPPSSGPLSLPSNPIFLVLDTPPLLRALLVIAWRSTLVRSGTRGNPSLPLDLRVKKEWAETMVALDKFYGDIGPSCISKTYIRNVLARGEKILDLIPTSLPPLPLPPLERAALFRRIVSLYLEFIELGSLVFGEENARGNLPRQGEGVQEARTLWGWERDLATLPSSVPPLASPALSLTAPS